MQKKHNHSTKFDKKSAAVCGLFCGACTLSIATREDPARLNGLAAQFQLSEEEVKCNGCRSDKKWAYCVNCKMFSCANERGIDFCVECEDYPCSDLKQFQSEKPHRIEIFDDLEQIKVMGYEYWFESIRIKYTCPRCLTINSAYDLGCRKCGQEPSCDYVIKHKRVIEQALNTMK